MQLTFSGLGQAQVLVDDRPLKFATEHGRALLFYLAIEANRPHTRTTLASLLWPDRPEGVALQNLRQALFNLRQSLQRLLGENSLLDVHARTVQFMGSNGAASNGPANIESGGDAPVVNVDVQRFQELIAACRAHSHLAMERCPACVERLQQAVGLYQGEFLAGIYLNSQLFDEWMAFLRQQLHIQALTAMHTLTLHFELRGDYERMRQMALRQLALEAWNEEAHRQVMRALMSSGDRLGAMAHYAACRRILQEEVGAAPSAETTLLYEQIVENRYVAEIQPARRNTNTLASKEPSLTGLHAYVEQLPSHSTLYGRDEERATLEQWLVQARCRVVGVVGMGGVGKTSLVADVVAGLAENVAGHFEVVMWQSLLNSRPWEEFLEEWLERLSDHQLITLPSALDKQLALLLGYLRQRRCLVVLDNLESVLPSTAGSISGSTSGASPQADTSPYASLVRYLAENTHQSTLIFTSRERPSSLGRIEATPSTLQLMSLRGLDVAAGQAMLTARQVVGLPADVTYLIRHYSGNPLALKLVTEAIHELFAGDVAAFIATGSPVFGDIRTVLDEQFLRLSRLEHEILLWFAVAREPLSLPMLQGYLLTPVSSSLLLETVRALQQRTLLERVAVMVEGEAVIAFALQNVVMEFLTERVIDEAVQEVTQEEFVLLHAHPLLITQGYEHVRQSQLRVLMQPICQRLLTHFGKAMLVEKFGRILAGLHAQPFTPSYAAGNLLNLMVQLDFKMSGYDFSHLAIRQADLRNAELEGVNFAGAEFGATLFADAFGPILCVAASPEGALVATGTVDGQLRLWTSATAQLVRTYTGHAGAIAGVAFSPDSHLLASCGEDQTIRIWNLHTHAVRILRGHTGRVFALSFSPDGKSLASGSEDNSLRLWDVASGETRFVMAGHSHWVRSLAFSPDGRTLASGSSDHTIGFWNAATGQLVKRLEAHNGWVNALSYSPTGRMLASGSSDHLVCLWDVTEIEKATVLETLHSHTLWVWSVQFNHDGTLLASSGSDGVVRLWRIDARAENEHRGRREASYVIHLLRGSLDIVGAVAFTPDGNTLVTGGSDQLLRFWDAPQGQLRYVIRGYDRTARAVAFSADGKTVVTGSFNRLIHLWDVASGVPLQRLRGHDEGVGVLTFSPDGSLLASAGGDRLIRVWAGMRDLAHVHMLYELHGHEGEVAGLAFSPDGSLLASAGADKSVRLWNVRSGTIHSILRHHSDEVRAVTFSQDGLLVISGSDDQQILVWEVATGQLQRVLGHHDNAIWFASVSPDGKLVATSSSDQSIRLWALDGVDQKPVAILQGHRARIFVVRFSSDGKWLVSGSADRTIKIWDVEQRTLVRTLQGHSHWVLAVNISRDGQWIASGGPDESVRLWERETGRCVRVLHIPGPYASMDIREAGGLSTAQITSLQALGSLDGG